MRWLFITAFFLVEVSTSLYGAEEQKRSKIIHLPGKKIEGHTFIWVNGVKTSDEKAMRIAQQLSDKVDGADIYFIYRTSNGLFLDLFEFVWINPRGLSPTERLIIDFTRTTLQEKPDDVLHFYGHSQGGLNIYKAGRHLSEKELKQMKVVTFGTAKIIPEKMFRNSHNYISKFDVIPFFDTLNYLRAYFGKLNNVTFVEPNSTSMIKEHLVKGKTYQSVIAEELDKFKEIE